MTEATWQAKRRELLEEEQRAWEELHALVDSVSEEDVVSGGYYEEGWTVKDVLAQLHPVVVLVALTAGWQQGTLTWRRRRRARYDLHETGGGL